MLQIARVDILDGQTLDIELSNGHLILFDTQCLPKADHRYDSLRNLELLPRPSTDGQNIFWRDGTRIALTEILNWLPMQTIKE
ncbi:hypothetical protein [Caproiciproducens sp.]